MHANTSKPRRRVGLYSLLAGTSSELIAVVQHCSDSNADRDPNLRQPQRNPHSEAAFEYGSSNQASPRGGLLQPHDSQQKSPRVQQAGKSSRCSRSRSPRSPYSPRIISFRPSRIPVGPAATRPQTSSPEASAAAQVTPTSTGSSKPHTPQEVPCIAPEDLLRAARCQQPLASARNGRPSSTATQSANGHLLLSASTAAGTRDQQQLDKKQAHGAGQSQQQPRSQQVQRPQQSQVAALPEQQLHDLLQHQQPRKAAALPPPLPQLTQAAVASQSRQQQQLQQSHAQPHGFALQPLQSAEEDLLASDDGPSQMPEAEASLSHLVVDPGGIPAAPAATVTPCAPLQEQQQQQQHAKCLSDAQYWQQPQAAWELGREIGMKQQERMCGMEQACPHEGLQPLVFMPQEIDPCSSTAAATGQQSQQLLQQQQHQQEQQGNSGVQLLTGARAGSMQQQEQHDELQEQGPHSVALEQGRPADRQQKLLQQPQEQQRQGQKQQQVTQLEQVPRTQQLTDTSSTTDASPAKQQHLLARLCAKHGLPLPHPRRLPGQQAHPRSLWHLDHQQQQQPQQQMPRLTKPGAELVRRRGELLQQLKHSSISRRQPGLPLGEGQPAAGAACMESAASQQMANSPDNKVSPAAAAAGSCTEGQSCSLPQQGQQQGAAVSSAVSPSQHVSPAASELHLVDGLQYVHALLGSIKLPSSTPATDCPAEGGRALDSSLQRIELQQQQQQLLLPWPACSPGPSPDKPEQQAGDQQQQQQQPLQLVVPQQHQQCWRPQATAGQLHELCKTALARLRQAPAAASDSKVADRHGWQSRGPAAEIPLQDTLVLLCLNDSQQQQQQQQLPWACFAGVHAAMQQYVCLTAAASGYQELMSTWHLQKQQQLGQRLCRGPRQLGLRAVRTVVTSQHTCLLEELQPLRQCLRQVQRCLWQQQALAEHAARTGCVPVSPTKAAAAAGAQRHGNGGPAASAATAAARQQQQQQRHAALPAWGGKGKAPQGPSSPRKQPLAATIVAKRLTVDAVLRGTVDLKATCAGWEGTAVVIRLLTGLQRQLICKLVMGAARAAASIAADRNTLVQVQLPVALQVLQLSAAFSTWRAWAATRSDVREVRQQLRSKLQTGRAAAALQAWRAAAQASSWLKARHTVFTQQQQRILVLKTFRAWRFAHTEQQLGLAQHALAVLWHARVKSAQALIAWAGVARQAALLAAMAWDSDDSPNTSSSPSRRQSTTSFDGCSSNLAAALELQQPWRTRVLSAVEDSQRRCMDAYEAVDSAAAGLRAQEPPLLVSARLMLQSLQQQRQQRVQQHLESGDSEESCKDLQQQQQQSCVRRPRAEWSAMLLTDDSSSYVVPGMSRQRSSGMDGCPERDAWCSVQMTGAGASLNVQPAAISCGTDAARAERVSPQQQPVVQNAAMAATAAGLTDDAPSAWPAGATDLHSIRHAPSSQPPYERQTCTALPNNVQPGSRIAARSCASAPHADAHSSAGSTAQGIAADGPAPTAASAAVAGHSCVLDSCDDGPAESNNHLRDSCNLGRADEVQTAAADRGITSQTQSAISQNTNGQQLQQQQQLDQGACAPAIADAELTDHLSTQNSPQHASSIGPAAHHGQHNSSASVCSRGIQSALQPRRQPAAAAHAVAMAEGEPLLAASTGNPAAGPVGSHMQPASSTLTNATPAHNSSESSDTQSYSVSMIDVAVAPVRVKAALTGGVEGASPRKSAAGATDLAQPATPPAATAALASQVSAAVMSEPSAADLGPEQEGSGRSSQASAAPSNGEPVAQAEYQDQQLTAPGQGSRQDRQQQSTLQQQQQPALQQQQQEKLVQQHQCREAHQLAAMHDSSVVGHLQHAAGGSDAHQNVQRTSGKLGKRQQAHMRDWVLIEQQVEQQPVAMLDHSPQQLQPQPHQELGHQLLQAPLQEHQQQQQQCQQAGDHTAPLAAAARSAEADRQLLQGSLGQWLWRVRSKALLVRVLTAAEAAWDRQVQLAAEEEQDSSGSGPHARDFRLMQRAFEAWQLHTAQRLQDAAALASMEAAAAYHSSRLTVKAWRAWQLHTQQAPAVQQRHSSALCSLCFQGWYQHMLQQRNNPHSRLRVCQLLRARTGWCGSEREWQRVVVLRKALGGWLMLMWRGAIHCRFRLLTSALTGWQLAVKETRERLLVFHDRWQRQRLLHHSLVLWRSLALLRKQQRQEAAAAGNWHQSKLARSVLLCWADVAAVQAARRAATAAAVRSYERRLMRRKLLQWSLVACASSAARVYHHHQFLLKVLAGWRQLVAAGAAATLQQELQQLHSQQQHHPLLVHLLPPSQQQQQHPLLVTDAAAQCNQLQPSQHSQHGPVVEPQWLLRAAGGPTLHKSLTHGGIDSGRAAQPAAARHSSPGALGHTLSGGAAPGDVVGSSLQRCEQLQTARAVAGLPATVAPWLAAVKAPSGGALPASDDDFRSSAGSKQHSAASARSSPRKTQISAPQAVASIPWRHTSPAHAHSGAGGGQQGVLPASPLRGHALHKWASPVGSPRGDAAMPTASSRQGSRSAPGPAIKMSASRAGREACNSSPGKLIPAVVLRTTIA